MKKVKVSKILVVTLSNVGDVAVTTPVMAALKEKYPGAKLWVMVGPKAKGVLSSSPEIDRLIVYDKHISWSEKLKLALSVRKERFDLVVDLRNTAFPFLAGASLKTSPIRWTDSPNEPMRDCHFRRLRFLGIQEFPARPFRFTGERERQKAHEVLHRLGLEAGKFICLAPGARDEKKRWSATRFGELASRLERHYGFPVLLLGSPEERSILAEVNEAAGGALRILEEPLQLEEVMAILNESRFFCGNDSGLFQITHEMQIPAVGVFGPSNIHRTGYNDALARTVFALARDPDDPRGGLDALTVEKVFAACEEIFDSVILAPPRGGSHSLRGTDSLAAPPVIAKDVKQSPRILVTRIDRIGDVILTTPVFERIKQIYPDAFLAVLVSPLTASVVEGNPFVDKVLVYDKKGAEKSWLGTWSFARALRREGFDAAIHFHSTNRVFWLSFLAGIPIRIGFDRKSSWLLTHSVEEHKWEGSKHESEYNLDLLEEALGILKQKPAQPIISISAEENYSTFVPLHEKDKQSLIQKVPEISEKSFIVLSPSASCPSKRWPPENFARVGERLAQAKKYQFFVIGTEAEKSISSEVARSLKAPCRDLSGELSLGELSWLLKESKLLISNDSGPVHLASAVGTPVISLFGRSDAGLSPTRWRPLGEKAVYIHKTSGEFGETTDYTRPCPRLLAITPEEVVSEALKLL